MKVAISQPEHFPYLGYFQKMAQADLFILLDHVKFQGVGSFQARNWFFNASGDREWFGLCVKKGSSHRAIDEVELVDEPHWRRKLDRKLAMHFPKHQLSTLYGAKLLVDVNINSILYCRERLSLEHIPLVRSSALKARTTKSQLVADLCHEVGATHYICGPGALAYLDMSCFNGLLVERFEPTAPDFQSSLAHLDD